MNIKKIRDLTLVSLDEERYLVVCCDSCGAIGEKDGDIVKTTGEIVGRETAKTVLSELICIGAKPLVLSDGLAVEMNDTGKKIINGINESIDMLQDSSVHLTGSTEDNMKTIQTGLGMTGIGIVKKDELKYSITDADDILVCVGLPLVGYDVIENPDKVMNVRDYEIIRKQRYVKEMVPVGSKGIAFEISEICRYNSISFAYNDDITIDIKSSAGPASCCVVTLEKKDYKKLYSTIKKPITTIGRFNL